MTKEQRLADLHEFEQQIAKLCEGAAVLRVAFVGKLLGLAVEWIRRERERISEGVAS